MTCSVRPKEACCHSHLLSPFWILTHKLLKFVLIQIYFLSTRIYLHFAVLAFILGISAIAYCQFFRDSDLLVLNSFSFFCAVLLTPLLFLFYNQSNLPKLFPEFSVVHISFSLIALIVFLFCVYIYPLENIPRYTTGNSSNFTLSNYINASITLASSTFLLFQILAIGIILFDKIR